MDADHDEITGQPLATAEEITAWLSAADDELVSALDDNPEFFADLAWALDGITDAGLDPSVIQVHPGDPPF